MSARLEYLSNKASVTEITEHLSCCDADFTPPLSTRVEIDDYAQKIMSKAIRFEAWSDGALVGLVAAYCNDPVTRIAYITSVTVLQAWARKGVATRLMDQCVEYAKASGMQKLCLEVATENIPAIKLYKKSGFRAGRTNVPFVSMNLYLKSGDEHEQ